MQITQIFTADGLFHDHDGDGLPDGLSCQILVDPRLKALERLAVANLAVRLGVELTAYDRSPFCVYDAQSCKPERYLLITPGRRQLGAWHKADEGILWIHDSQSITISGGRGLAELVKWLTCGYPRLGGVEGRTLAALLSHKGIAASSIVGLAVARGRIQAVYSRQSGITRRIVLSRPLWDDSLAAQDDLDAVELGPYQHDLMALFGSAVEVGGEQCLLPIVVDDFSDLGSTMAACHLGLRMGLEHIEVRLPLVSDGRVRRAGGSRLYIKVQGDQGCQLEQDDRGVVTLKGNSECLEMASRYLAEQWPHALTRANHPDPIRGWVGVLNELARMKTDVAEAAWLLGSAVSGKHGAVSEVMAHGALSEQMRRSLHSGQSQPIRITDRIERDLVEVREFSLPWEVDELWKVVKGSLPPVLASQGCRQTTLQVFISEPLGVRQRLEDELRCWLDTVGYRKVNIQVLSGYKPGLSWISEIVLPELAQLQVSGTGLDQIRIGYELFKDPDHLELPSRWLQELYPIDELIARQTGLSVDAIEFVPMEEEHGPRYHVEALTNGSVVQQWTLACFNGDRPYLDRFPDAGRVKTFRSWAALVDGDNVLWAQSFASDLEMVWERYQAEVLPWIESHLGEDGALHPERQPLFRELAVELWASEEDQRLGVREERLSPLEAMHEEFYFTTLDWFSRLGSSVCGTPLRRPGAIVPWMRQRVGQGAVLRVSMRQVRPLRTEIVFSTGERLLPSACSVPADPKLQSLRFVQQGGCLVAVPTLTVRANEGLQAALRGLQAMAEKGIVELPAIPGGAIVSVDSGRGAPVAYRFPHTEGEKSVIDLPQLEPVPSDVIGYEQMQEQVRVMRAHGIGRVETLTRSLGGRSVEMIELLSPIATIVSRAKLAAAKPTYLVIARHHANEVSSSNAALLLARQLAKGKRAVLAGVNVVIIPMENPDGAALHSRLAAEAPDWKHHAARFSALGEDLAVGYFQDQPPDPASMALTRAWQAWRPDVVGDNHGVPSHEWEQPFSGYVCPWFSTFWMPRALYYGYFTYVDDPGWPEHRRMAEALRWEVSGRLAENTAIAELNAVWRDRYLKYAHRPCPEKFLYDEEEFCQGLLTYCSGANRESKSVTAARRFPDQTVLWWIDEVNDETAHGEYLGLCVQAHLDSNLAVIDYLTSLPPQLQREQYCYRGSTVFKWSRPRPLDVTCFLP
ncbi:MAG: M14 family metallopeptidase [Bacillota bacterium]